jgi:hypothetical protein
MVRCVGLVFSSGVSVERKLTSIILLFYKSKAERKHNGTSL